ncbi:MAG: pseudouridine synthase [Betaproteobacteria bacterium]
MMRPVQLATKEGVSPSRVFLPASDFTLILDFLEWRFPRGTRLGWERRMLAGRVFDQHGKVVSPDASYQANQTIYYYRELKEEIPIPVTEGIVYQDERIVIADKPHYLPISPIGPYIQETLQVRLRKRLGLDYLTAAHRLDLETAGLVMFTIHPEHRNAYQALFRQRKIEKVYHAITDRSDEHNQLQFPLMRRSRIENSARFMQMQECEGEFNAHTQIDLLQRGDNLSIYELRPLTGKKHQLRVHMNALGLPILHDQIYPEMKEYVPLSNRTYIDKLQLLAFSLRFEDPYSLKNVYVESQIKLMKI